MIWASVVAILAVVLIFTIIMSIYTYTYILITYVIYILLYYIIYNMLVLLPSWSSPSSTKAAHTGMVGVCLVCDKKTYPGTNAPWGNMKSICAE